MTGELGFAYYRWPLAVILGLSLVVVVNMALLRLALGGGSELAEQHPYEAGLAFEEKLQELKRGVELGLTDTFRVGAADADGFRVLEAMLPIEVLAVADPQAVGTVRVVVKASYAADSALDRQFELLAEPGSPQLFQTRVRLQRGAWQLSLYIETPKTRVRASRNLLLD